METVYADRLYEFLTGLAEVAEARNDRSALERIEFARKHYLPPLTSEFLGVSMVALREILSRSEDLLSAQQAKEARQYVSAISRQWFS
jgi:hypothetical protein